MSSLTRMSARYQVMLAMLALVALVVAATWPIATDPAHLSVVRPTDNDYRLNNYFIFWGAHALTTDPIGLHHTNMFHPEPYTFVYADMLVSQSLLVLPVIAAFRNPVLTYNLLLMMGLVIGGTGFFVLGRRITGHPAAAFLGSMLWVFNPAHFTRYQQIQLIGDHWLPWLCWALWRWLDAHEADDRSARWPLAAAFFFCLNALSGSHLAVFGAVLAAIIVVCFATARSLWRERQFQRQALVFGAACLVVLGPLFFPYLLVEEQMAATRAATLDLAGGSLRPLEAFSARSRLYQWIDTELNWPSGALNPEARELRAHGFPGVVTLLLGALSLFVAPASMRTSRRIWAIALVTLVLLAMGSYGAYGLVGNLPLFRLIRVPSRFLIPAVLALAVLATIGAAGLAQRLRPARWAVAVLVLVAIVFAGEANFAPLRTWNYDHEPRPLNTFLAAQPGDFAIVEFPLEPFSYAINMRQVHNSMFHWKKLLVGYSGYQSAQNIDLLRRVRDTFPANECLDELASLDVRFVVVLADRVDESLLEAVAGQPRLQPAWEHEGWLVLRLDSAGE